MMSPDHVESFREVSIRLAAIEKKDGEVADELKAIRAKLDSIKEIISQDFVRKDLFDARFKPVERLVWTIVMGLGGLIATGMGYALWPH